MGFAGKTRAAKIGPDREIVAKGAPFLFYHIHVLHFTRLLGHLLQQSLSGPIFAALVLPAKPIPVRFLQLATTLNCSRVLKFVNQGPFVQN